ncbi:regulator of microtubule dynamics protein 2 [Orycteropus afer afer]|uniref:Regulator of microtubule dynamics protein 2 n=1 Tax=Orycteropus afer afer TaxID=1230840 RepID=A0AC54Z983_ORYAF|nr:regulator of microtubule dynamics protein 2 [Orycteropus afer afer]
MGKCLSCCHKDQHFQLYSSEEQATADRQPHQASSVTQPTIPLCHLKFCPPETHRVSSSKRSHSLPSQSNISTLLSLPGRRHSLFSKLEKSSAPPCKQQSRVNFDSQEKLNFNSLNSSTYRFGPRFQRLFSAPRLSVVSCYQSTTFFDPQSSNQKFFPVNEIGMFSKGPSIANPQKYSRFSAPEYSNKPFMHFETIDTSSAHGNIDKAAYFQNTAVLISQPIVSFSYSQNNIATDIQQRNQSSKDSANSLYPGSQSHNPSHSSALNAVFSSVCKSTCWFTPCQSEMTFHSFEDGNPSDSPQDEDKSSAVETPKTRYITANTDTEEQSFPVPKAFNTHVQELNLGALLQKADHLRVTEPGKMESFELLCDHKEKFKDEIEFIWRLARAYGDMYELSTNIQEKKHYANIGKTLGERAITRAPMNGYCHLWFAVLCGYVSEFEGLQNKINYGYRFKEHLDKAIQFLPEEPFLYYLKGRYCYTVSKLSWIEKKMAATLFGKIPSSTVGEALQNFLKTEELHPGYSKSNYMYLAKCYVDLEQKHNALKFCNLALSLSSVTKEVGVKAEMGQHDAGELGVKR